MSVDASTVQTILFNLQYLSSVHKNPRSCSLLRNLFSLYFCDPLVSLSILESIVPSVQELREHLLPVIKSLIETLPDHSCVYDTPKLRQLLHISLSSSSSPQFFLQSAVSSCFSSINSYISSSFDSDQFSQVLDLSILEFYNRRITLSTLKLKSQLLCHYSSQFTSDNNFSLLLCLKTLVSEAKSIVASGKIDDHKNMESHAKVVTGTVFNQFLKRLEVKAASTATSHCVTVERKKTEHFGPPPKSPFQLKLEQNLSMKNSRKNLEHSHSHVDIVNSCKNSRSVGKNLGENLESTDNDEASSCSFSSSSYSRPQSAPFKPFNSAPSSHRPSRPFSAFPSTPSTPRTQPLEDTLNDSFTTPKRPLYSPLFEPLSIEQKGSMILNYSTKKTRLMSATKTRTPALESELNAARKRLDDIGKKSELVSDLSHKMKWLTVGMLSRLDYDELLTRFEPYIPDISDFPLTGPHHFAYVDEGRHIAMVRGLIPHLSVERLSMSQLLSAVRYLNDQEAAREYLRQLKRQSVSELFGSTQAADRGSLFRTVSKPFHPDFCLRSQPAAHATHFRNFCSQIFVHINLLFKETQDNKPV
ncbi:hypothetical protein RCL1_006042 [Eukaryota sp. TZLM3-RCL]